MDTNLYRHEADQQLSEGAGGGREGGREASKRAKETLGVAEYTGHREGFTSVHTCQNLSSCTLYGQFVTSK